MTRFGSLLRYSVASAGVCNIIWQNFMSVFCLTGTSMLPTLAESDVVVCDRRWWKKVLEKGDIVVARNVRDVRTLVCKRVMARSGDLVLVKTGFVEVPEGFVWLEGDNSYDSYDSRFEAKLTSLIMDPKCSLLSNAYEGRPEFQNVWEAMTRKMHLFWLAQPNKRAVMPYPDPSISVAVPRPISKAALKYEPSERINLMSTPKKAKITPKYEKPVEKETVVEPAALLAVASPHLIELAKPVVRDYSTQKKKSKAKVGKRGRRKRKDKAKRSPEIREAWLVKNAAPKKWPPPPHIHPHKQRFIMRGSTKTLIKERKRFTIPQKPLMKISKSELYRRCVYLSIPSRRRDKFKWSIERDDFTERRQKKLAERPTETIRKLALPKPIPEEAQLDLKFKPFRINKGALHYKATERIVTLATPIQKQARVDSDIKENPFGVVKRALKAICSKRVAELAQPVMRD